MNLTDCIFIDMVEFYWVPDYDISSESLQTQRNKRKQYQNLIFSCFVYNILVSFLSFYHIVYLLLLWALTLPSIKNHGG